MSQNIASIVFTDEQRTGLLDALAALEIQLVGKTVALKPALRRDLFKMGVKSETFCRQAVAALDRNRQVVPPSLGLDDALADLLALDILRPVLQRLEQMTELLRDTEMALGSDLMETAVEGYGLLKVIGDSQGLDTLRRDLGTRFARRGRKTGDEPEPVPGDTPARGEVPTAA